MLMIFPWSISVHSSVAIFDPAAMNPRMSDLGILARNDKRGPEWAGRDRNDETAHLDVSAHVLNGFRIFDHRQSGFWAFQSPLSTVMKTNGTNREGLRGILPA
jgi:hypothetical protein